MKKKRENEANMMEEAIEKASLLITLLQKENTDLKKKVDLLDKEITKAHAENQQLKMLNNDLEQQYAQYENKREELKAELERVADSLSKSEENLRRKIGTNKELHEKISVLNSKLKQRSKSINDEKTRILSLQNENQYLLKRLKDYEQKQNLGTQKINLKYLDYQNQLKEIMKIKDAFARRCEELKADNAVLTERAAQYKQKLIETQAYLAFKQRIIDQMPNRDIKIDQKFDKKIDTNNIYYQQLVQKLVKDKLGVAPEASFEGKIDQINSFLSYRLTHIEKMCQGIMQKLQIKQWQRLQNLRDLNSSSLRLYSYISELLGKTL